MTWAFYLHPYEVALAATESLDVAKEHVQGKSKGHTPMSAIPDIKSERKSFLEDLEFKLESRFGEIWPYAVELYKTKHAKALNYMTSNRDGIGGRPNAVLLMDKKLALLQFRTYFDDVKDVDIMQGVGLNLITRCNKSRIANAFYNEHKATSVSENIYFLTSKGILEHPVSKNEEEKFKLYAKMLRQTIALS
jgi:hypothetical protein